jgi:3-hydroxyisobutyrate dehydrogenase-like beta-hydroxyacid dehydrogenase
MQVGFIGLGTLDASLASNVRPAPGTRVCCAGCTRCLASAARGQAARGRAGWASTGTLTSANSVVVISSRWPR